MFGYIKTYKPEMKICEFDAYKAVYCSVCKQLQKDYGIFARFTLNYDYTFLAMMRMAATKTCVKATKGRCPFNPLKKCNHVHCEDTSLEYACAMAMMMVYNKWKDTKDDEGFYKRALAFLVTPFVKPWYKNASLKYPKIQSQMMEYYQNQKDVESKPDACFDEYAHPTAHIIGYVFSYGIDDDKTSKILYSIGYNVGKWVYLLDALDDFTEDCKKGCFNPYVVRLGKDATSDQVIEFATAQLNICLDEACMAFDLLPKGNFHPILHNILFLGMDNQYKEIIGKVKRND